MTDVFPSTFQFRGEPPWEGVPAVNGFQLTGVTSFDVHVAFGEVPVVTLTMLPADALRLVLGDGPVSVGVCDATREALVSLGWTPPPDEPPVDNCA